MVTLVKEESFNGGQISMFHSYVVDGTPIPLARHRHSNDHTWDPQKELKRDFALQVQAQHTSKTFFKGPIHLDVTFYFAVPKTSKSARENALHVFKPDLSNLLKFVEDALIGILYKDDCIIATLSAAKKYDTRPRTEFTISEKKSYD